MAKQSYKVIDPKGVTGFNGRKYAKDEIVDSEPDAHLKAWLRFGQVEEVKAKPAAPAPKGKEAKGAKPEEQAANKTEEAAQ
jgi:hypothetical protein